MLAYIGLLLHVLLLVPMGSFLPLFSSSPAERKKKNENSSSLFLCWVELHCICYACVRGFVCQTMRKQRCLRGFKSTYSLWLLQVWWFSWGSHPQKLEQVALLQHVAQGHVKQDTWLLVETATAVGNKPVPVSQDMLPQANITLPEGWYSREILMDYMGKKDACGPYRGSCQGISFARQLFELDITLLNKQLES